jgi:hypothetical protein
MAGEGRPRTTLMCGRRERRGGPAFAGHDTEFRRVAVDALICPQALSAACRRDRSRGANIWDYRQATASSHRGAPHAFAQARLSRRPSHGLVRPALTGRQSRRTIRPRACLSLAPPPACLLLSRGMARRDYRMLVARWREHRVMQSLAPDLDRSSRTTAGAPKE